MKPATPLRTCAALTLLVLPGIARAERIPGQLFDNFPERAWLESYDPTLISSRVFSEFIYESYDTDTDVFKIENTLRWGIPLNSDVAFGFQVMLPTKWVETADDDEFGFGDLEARAGVVGRISSCVRYGIGVNAVMDTATDDLLGDDAFVLRPTVAIRWDVTNRVTIGYNIEYNVTPSDEGESDVSALELKFPVVFKISDDWSAFMSYNPRWNYLDESDRQRLELGATWIWGPEKQYALSFGTEVPLGSESFEYKLAAGFHWYF
jgi:hypothetical protein